MSTVTSYTFLSRPAASRKISSPPMQTRKQAPAAVALPWVRSKLSPLSVCHAYKYDVPPFALVHPKFSPSKSDHWKVTEDADRINLWFKVEEDKTQKDDLEVATNGNVLLIRYKQRDHKQGDHKEKIEASSLDVRLLMPAGYEKEPKTMVEAELTFGSLLVTVTKPKLKATTIPVVGPSDD